MDEEEEEEMEGTTTAKERSSSPTSTEMDLLVHIIAASAFPVCND